MIEHADTIKIIRADIIEEISTLVYSDESKLELATQLYELKIAETATTLQLRAILRLIKQDRPDLKLVHGPAERDPYIGVTFSGMFVGIEPDGYAHS